MLICSVSISLVVQPQELRKGRGWDSSPFKQCFSLGTTLYALPIILGVKLTALLKTVGFNEDSCLTRNHHSSLSKRRQGKSYKQNQESPSSTTLNHKNKWASQNPTFYPLLCSHFSLENLESGCKYNSQRSKKNVNNLPVQHLLRAMSTFLPAQVIKWTLQCMKCLLDPFLWTN